MKHEEVKWTPVVVLTAAAITISTCVPMGYQISVINTPADIILVWSNESIASRYNYVLTPLQLDTLWSAIASIYLVGGFLASLVAPAISDRFGRKGTLILINVLSVVAGILFVVSPYTNAVEVLLVARLVIGIAGGLTLCTVPMYLTEIGHVTQRGALGSLTQLGIAFGMLLGELCGYNIILGTGTTWNYLLAAYLVYIVLASVALPILPESPKYLYVIKRNRDRCMMELYRLRGLPAERLQEELDELEVNLGVEQDNKYKHSLWSVAKSPRLRMPLILVIVVQAGMSVSGVDVLLFYSTSLFKSINLSLATSINASLVAAVVSFVMSVVAVYMSHHFGRRALLVSSCFFTALFQVLLTITLETATRAIWLPHLSIVLVLSIIISFYIGLASLPAFLATELFLVGPSSVAMSYVAQTYWLLNLLVTMTYPVMRGAIGGFVFMPYAVTTALVGVFVWMYLPETKDRKTKDISEMLSHGFSSNIRSGMKKLLAPKSRYVNPWSPNSAEDKPSSSCGDGK